MLYNRTHLSFTQWQQSVNVEYWVLHSHAYSFPVAEVSVLVKLPTASEIYVMLHNTLNPAQNVLLSHCLGKYCQLRMTATINVRLNR